jgi:hypothetical protein
MEDLVARNVFGELTLGDVWDAIDCVCEIEVYIPHLTTTLFRYWDDSDSRLRLYHYPEDEGTDQSPHHVFRMGSKVKVSGDQVIFDCAEEKVYLTFRKSVPVDLSRFLPSSKKPG